MPAHPQKTDHDSTTDPGFIKSEKRSRYLPQSEGFAEVDRGIFHPRSRRKQLNRMSNRPMILPGAILAVVLLTGPLVVPTLVREEEPSLKRAPDAVAEAWVSAAGRGPS
jgi:hypothetical protein